MSDALITTHDAITPYWDGEQTTPGDPKLPEGEAYLDKLRHGSQILVVAARLKQAITVEYTAAACPARVCVASDPALTLQRPTENYFLNDLLWLRAYDDLRADRLLEIHQQLGDVMSFFGALGMLDRGRREKSMAFLTAVQQLAVFVHSQVKYFCRAPRPIDFAMEVQPMIQTPDHSSFPSGHATEAFAVATVFHHLMTGKSAVQGICDSELPFRLAHRVAVNRTVAGVHFPVDSLAGAVLGCQVGEIALATAQGCDVPRLEFCVADPGEHPTKDFLLDQNLITLLEGERCVPVACDEIVAYLYNEAKSEWPPYPPNPVKQEQAGGQDAG